MFKAAANGHMEDTTEILGDVSKNKKTVKFTLPYLQIQLVHQYSYETMVVGDTNTDVPEENAGRKDEAVTSSTASDENYSTSNDVRVCVRCKHHNGIETPFRTSWECASDDPSYKG